MSQKQVITKRKDYRRLNQTEKRLENSTRKKRKRKSGKNFFSDANGGDAKIVRQLINDMKVSNCIFQIENNQGQDSTKFKDVFNAITYFLIIETVNRRRQIMKQNKLTSKNFTVTYGSRNITPCRKKIQHFKLKEQQEAQSHSIFSVKVAQK